MPRPAPVRIGTALIAAVGLATGLASAQPAPTPGPARLVADLNTAPVGSDPFPFIRLNGEVLFGADTVEHGRELFATDGTFAGTRLVKDLFPGGRSGLTIYTPDGGLSLFTRVGDEDGGIIYLAADDGIHGTELWVTDGTEAGTRMVKDISPGPASSWPRNVFVQAGVLYFTADDGVHGLEPWRTDGTEGATTLVADVITGPDPSRARVIGIDALGYYLSSQSPTAIWKKNFALPGAVMLHDRGVDDGQSILFGSAMLFRGWSPTAGDELWTTAGTPPATAQLADLYLGSQSSAPETFVQYQGQVYCRAATSSSGGSLIRTDGTAPGTTTVFGSWNSRLLGLSGEFGGRLLLRVTDSSGRRPAVWATDLTAVGTTNIAGLYLNRVLDGAYANYAPQLIQAGGSLYMLGATAATPPPAPPQVFRYDGATGASVNAVTVTSATGPGPRRVAAFEVTGGRIVMAADEDRADNQSDFELWASNAPGALASSKIAELNPATQGSVLSWLRGSAGRLFILDRATTVPGRLTITDGTPGSTRFAADANPDLVADDAAAGLGPAVLGDRLFYEHRTTATGLELWVSDGTGAPAGTHLVRDISPDAADTQFDQLTPSGDLMYFRVTTTGSAVWRTDGNAQTTFPVTPEDGAFSNLTDVDGRLFFVGRAVPSDPPGLWMTDGSVMGTTRVKAFTSLSIGGTPITPVRTTGKCFFASGPLSPEGRELWISNGTETGTTRVADIAGGPAGSNPAQITSAGRGAAGEPRIFFIAATPDAGAELWFSDGTEPGTRRVKDIRPGPASAAIDQLVAVVSATDGAPLRAYFIADDGTGPGAQLWTTDGTEAGTHALIDTNPAGDDRIGNFTIARGRLYFTADDGLHGLELWSSAGSAPTTALIADVRPGDLGGLDVIDPGNPDPRPHLTAVNSRLYFIGNDGAHGNEVMVLDLCPADFNNDGGISVQDIFDFLAAYFTAGDRADVNGENGVTVQDIFDYLRSYFAACG